MRVGGDRFSYAIKGLIKFNRDLGDALGRQCTFGDPPCYHLTRLCSSDRTWQTFGRLRLPFDQFIQRGRDFFSRLGQVYGARNDYAQSGVTRDGLDTAEVWGSSPHAPTISVNHSALTTAFSVTP